MPFRSFMWLAILGLAACSPAPEQAKPAKAVTVAPGLERAANLTGSLTKDKAMLAVYGAVQPWVSEDDQGKPWPRYRTFTAPPKIAEGQPRYYRIQPEILTQVGDSWVLVSGLSLPEAFHVDIGLVAVHYLRLEQGRWRVVGAWPWFLGGNSFGDPGDFSLSQGLLPGPTLLLDTGYSGMGQSCLSTNVIELTPQRPILRASILMEYDYLPTSPGSDLQEDEMRTAFTGTLKPDGGQSFLVLYRGEDGPRTAKYRLVPGQDEMAVTNAMDDDHC